MPRRVSRVHGARERLVRRVKNQSRRSGPRNNSGSSFGGQNSLTSCLERQIPLFPAKTTKMVRYSDDFNINAASGALTTYVFSANGLFDPNITSTGHQPMGFDTMMLCYEHYHVFAARARVIFRNLTATASTPFVGIRIDASDTPLTNYTQAVENGRFAYDTLSPIGVYGSTKELRANVNIPKTQGLNKRDFLANDNLRGSAAANPAEQTYFHVCLWDPTANLAGIICQMTIEYVAVFTEPRPQSLQLKRLEPESKISSEFQMLSLASAAVPGCSNCSTCK